MNFGAFAGGLAVGFALLLFRRDLFEKLLSSLPLPPGLIPPSPSAGCVQGRKELTPEEKAQVPFSWKP
jgi:hypothetical protein